MENNKNTNLETTGATQDTSVQDGATSEETTNTENKNVDTDKNNTSDTVTMSQADYEKKIQSETDKVRTEYSKKVKELEAKIKELTPVTKSESEIDFENRLAALEAREKALNLSDALNKKGISNELSKFLRDDVDVEALAGVIEGIVGTKLKTNSYVPGGHKSGESMTKEEFRKLSMDEKERIYTENPELFKTLAGR